MAKNKDKKRGRNSINSLPLPAARNGRRRVIIENVRPLVNNGQYPVKRTIGDIIDVFADVFADGHDVVAARVRYRHESKKKWHTVPMHALDNDNWTASFSLTHTGLYLFMIEGWVDNLLSWRHDLERKAGAGRDVSVELRQGAILFSECLSRASAQDKKKLKRAIILLDDIEKTTQALQYALSEESKNLMLANPHYVAMSVSARYEVVVERKLAGCSSWYEFFPRSVTDDPTSHGTFSDCEKLLPKIAAMGFDIVYLPPIHPIGFSFRKGPDNAVSAKPGDPGSPWAIGGPLDQSVEQHLIESDVQSDAQPDDGSSLQLAPAGGHTAIHSQLGTIKDFRSLVKKAGSLQLEVALDLAFQCSQDHPWVREHPAWFKWRPDGQVQYAENPPKKYQDVLPLNFESEDWESLWVALLDIVNYWISEGVTVFRVDNPHTKPFGFWQWLIASVHNTYPDVIFLAEAFTRPAVMSRLAKLGFTHSYTYFTWRNSKWEIEAYMRELSNPPLSDFFRPNFWPNTPDILPWNLQHAPLSAFALRFLLASTLSSNYGIYGPVFELGVNEPVAGKEEYLHSEKYEIRSWNRDADAGLRPLITRVNHIRKSNAALQQTNNIIFCETDNDELIAYLKMTRDKSNRILVCVNLNPGETRSGWVRLPLDNLGKSQGDHMLMQDLLTGEKYRWEKEWNYVMLDPGKQPGHIFRILDDDQE